MGKYKHILFDVDGTLVDSYAVDVTSVAEMFDRHMPNHGKTEEDFASLFGIPGRDGLLKMGVAEEQIPELLQEWEATARTHCDLYKLFPSVLEVLDFLKKMGLQLAEITSRSRGCDMGGPFGKDVPEMLVPYIDRAICAGDTPRGKPAPDPILYYMEQTGAKREEILFVGDALTDLQAANAAGVDFALASWGYKGKTFPKCKHYLTNMWDLIAVCSEKEREYSLTAQLHSWARELNSLAQAGLTYCKDPFDHERYERLGDLAAQMAAYYVDEQAEVIRKQWLTDGYKTPQLDTRAAIFDDQGRILMVKEQRSQKWNVPGGWCDEDQTIMSNVVKEVREEAGMEVYPKRLIAILDRSKYNTVDTLGGCLKAFVLCSCGTESFEANCETSERRFFAEDELPVEELRTNTNTLEQLKMCFACYRAAEWTPIVE